MLPEYSPTEEGQPAQILQDYEINEYHPAPRLCHTLRAGRSDRCREEFQLIPAAFFTKRKIKRFIEIKSFPFSFKFKD
jgi:hypothetical protein